MRKDFPNGYSLGAIRKDGSFFYFNHKQGGIKNDQVPKTMCGFFALCVLLCLCAVPALADGGNVSAAIEGAWTDAAGQIKTVVNNVVFPAIDLILAVFFFGKLATCYFDYRKHSQFEWAGPAILFACLVFASTAPLYIWQVLGI